jgi:hypothetical protein
MTGNLKVPPRIDVVTANSFEARDFQMEAAKGNRISERRGDLP